MSPWRELWVAGCELQVAGSELRGAARTALHRPRVPRVGGCTNRNHTTHKVNRRRPDSEYPLVSVSALLQLSD